MLDVFRIADTSDAGFFTSREIEGVVLARITLACQR